MRLFSEEPARGDMHHLTKATNMTAPVEDVLVDTRGLNVYYGSNHALQDVTLPIPHHRITALMGPSGCGKSTFLRAINRMHDRTPGARVTGTIMFHQQNVLDMATDVIWLRQRLGMIFQKPVVFPKSIFENVAFGVRTKGGMARKDLRDRVEHSLQQAALWDEVRDRLHRSALDLSGGQQQRLCIARALAMQPEVLLMDEPTSALDPIATLKVEDLIHSLSQQVTIAIVTHNLQQAGRLSHYVGFFLLGQLIEFGPTKSVFEHPQNQHTEDFITGRFG